MAKATVAIRVEASLYDELVKIAEKRDVTITEALGFYIARKSKIGQASLLDGPASMEAPALCPRCGKPLKDHQIFQTSLVNSRSQYVLGIDCPES